MANSINPLNNYTAELTPQATLNGTIGTIVYASNYNDLDNKPSINSVELRGNKTASDLGLATPEDITVTSVNTQTGDVVLTGANIAYDNSYSVTDKINDLESQIVDSGVDSVNGMTGNVTLTATDINYSVGVSIKNKIDEVESEIPVVNYPVTSVNTKTGAVVLGGNDIEYSSGVSVNSKIDAVEQSIPVVDYPVTSVNEMTGDITLTGADIPLGSDFSDPTSTAGAIGDLTTLTTTDKSSAVGAINELDSDKLDKSTYTEKTSVTINSLVATGAVYTKKIGNMVMVWGLVTTTASITTGTAILTGMFMNNNGANNVVKFIDNNGTSPDWVLYTPNANNVLLSAGAQSSGHSYTVSFIYYSA